MIKIGTEPLGREVLDFSEFLERRYGIESPLLEAAPLREAARTRAFAVLAQIRIPWNGKPIPDRCELYDDASSGE